MAFMTRLKGGVFKSFLTSHIRYAPHERCSHNTVYQYIHRERERERGGGVGWRNGEEIEGRCKDGTWSLVSVPLYLHCTSPSLCYDGVGFYTSTIAF